MRLVRSFWFLFVIAAAACSAGISAPPPRFPHALAQHACGPTDGPAVAVFLARDAAESPPPATPYVRVYLDKSVDELDGHTWSVAGDNSQGGAWYYSSTDASEPATSGYMSATSVSDGTVIEGNVNLTFPKAGHVSGGFRAQLFPNPNLCG
ncbi:MAG TPA: hypothetical protein VJV79_05595 [Polyangiaceae bacterium]|nr:hypothetical protein [Polyangiaceae bacterium]